MLSNLVGCQSSTRNLDHSTDAEAHHDTLILEHLLCCLTDHFLLQVELIHQTNQWHHDFRTWVVTFLTQLDGSTEDGTCLHSSDFRIGIAQAASTMAQHWVALIQLSHTSLDFLYGNTHIFCHSFLTSQIVRYELVQWWVKQTDVNWAVVHYLQDLVEVNHLVRQNLLQCSLTAFFRICQNHLTHSANLLCLEEHVLCTAQTNTLGTEAVSYSSITRSISIGTYMQLGIFVAEVHQFSEVATYLSSLGIDTAFINFTCATVE